MKVGRFQLWLLDNVAWVLLVVFYAGFAGANPQAMINIDTLHFLLYSAVPIGFVVLAQSVVLITGNFDLSIAEAAGLAGMSTGVVLMHVPGDAWFTPALCVILPVALGAMCGALNGALVGKLGLNPFLVTMGTQIGFQGLKLLIRPQSIWSRDLPPFFISIGANEVSSIVIFLVVLVCLWFFLTYIRGGAYLYAVGGDKETSNMFGIRPDNTIFYAYLLSGIFAGLAAIFYAGFNKGIPINMAGGALFPAFAGAVIGGVAITGGRGSVVGAFAGSLLIGLLETGLTMFAISPDARKVAFAILVIGSILLDRVRGTLRDRILRPSSIV